MYICLFFINYTIADIIQYYIIQHTWKTQFTS